MRKLVLALAMLAAASGLSGCVIGPGPVVSQGKAQPADQRLNQISTKDLERPANLRDAVLLVKKYLNAAADKPETRLDTLRGYLREKSWTPGKELNIYRVFDPEKGGQSDDTIPVTVPMQKVGVLKDGRIEPVYADRADVVFNVVDGADGYLLKDAPAGLMLSDKMLSDMYETRAIYFWDKEGKRLVPDIRYIPRYLLEPEKAKLLIEYLYAGPSPWLSQAVKAPVGQVRNIPVFTKDGEISVDLQNQVGEEDLPKLATQLERMLVKQGQVSGVQFNIQGVQVQPGRKPPLDDTKPAARFAVQQGKVVRLDSVSDRANAAVALADTANVNVEWAMFSRLEESVALSQREGSAQRFLIGQSGAPKQVVIPGGKPVDQVAWLEGGSKAALVLSNQALYEVVPGPPGIEPKITPLVGALPGLVTNFSVVPDGRIALVIDKKFYMGALYHNGEVLAVTQPQQVPTALDQVQQVALARLDAVIAGVGLEQKQSKLILTLVNVDGSQQLPAWKDYQASEQVSHLVTDFRLGAAAYYDYNGSALQLGPGGATPVRDNQVVRPGGPPSPAASTTPAATPPLAAASFEG